MLSQFSKNKNSISAYWICWRPRNHRNLTKKSVGACHPAISLDRHLLKLHLGLEGWHWLSQWTAPSPEETRGQLAGPWWINWHKWPKWQNQQMCSWAKKPAVKELINPVHTFVWFLHWQQYQSKASDPAYKSKGFLSPWPDDESGSLHWHWKTIPAQTSSFNTTGHYTNQSGSSQLSQFTMTHDKQAPTFDKALKNTIQVQPSGCNTTQINQLSQFTINTSRPQHVTGLFDSFLNRASSCDFASASGEGLASTRASYQGPKAMTLSSQRSSTFSCYYNS